MSYKLEWLYCDLEPAEQPSDPIHFDIHFEFLLRFPDIPPGDSHVAHFCFNVLSPERAKELDISNSRRGFLVNQTFAYAEIVNSVEKTVEKAFNEHSHAKALETLNRQYVHTDLDFSSEFAADLKSGEEVIHMIGTAFAQVARGDGITLHQGTAIDNYADEDEFQRAGELDTDSRWQEVPDEAIAGNPHSLTFLDPRGFRYYLPAFMCWSIRNHSNDPEDAAFYTFLKLFPTVAPRDSGRGHGEQFDVKQFTEELSFSVDQVKAIYHFLCFMSLTADFKISEDQYPAMLQWRTAANGQID